MPEPREGDRAAGLTGRRAECAVLDALVDAVRTGESRALVVHGEAGVGKTALLDYVAGRAGGCLLTRAGGVQSEMELAFAGLHQLCQPLLEHLDGLPAPQRAALRVALGISEGPAPDRFLLGLAVLGLCSEAAEDRPLVCLIDDEQWLDDASARVLAFVARRLGKESVAMLFGARVPGSELDGLPRLEVAGLADADARTLLASVLTAPLDARVRDQIVAETRGNPLALLELPRVATAAQLAGGFAMPGATRFSGTAEESFRLRYAGLPAQTRQLLVVAAADPGGDPVLVWRAAARLGIAPRAAAAAADAGLAEFGSRVRFRHPLARSVAYQAASPAERLAAHRALAEATDPELDPDRRVWHLAQAATGADEEVARELERSAGRARARGGLAAAAAFLERAVNLTPDPARTAARALAAATTKFQAGAFGATQNLLAMAEQGPLSELDQARAEQLRAQLAFVESRGGDAPLLLARAAKRLEPIEPGMARVTYLDALAASMFAGKLASPGGQTLTVARAARAAPPPLHRPHHPDLLLAGLAANFTDGYEAAVPVLHRALDAFDDLTPDEQLRWLWMNNEAALHLWDDERWDALADRYVELARETGALSELPLALSTRAMSLLHFGDLKAAASVVDEGRTVTEATGSGLAPYSALFLAALRGRQEEALGYHDKYTADVVGRGEGIWVACLRWSLAVLHNGLGNYQEAAEAAMEALRQQEYPEQRYPGVANWAAAELVEAAVRAGQRETAVEACDWIATAAGASRTDWALGVAARARALVSDADAECHYRDALTALRRTRVRTDLARTYLLYGEWLRRQRRRGDARRQLRTALQMLEEMDLTAFAARARRELQATGETARKRAVPVAMELTAQEQQIASLAKEGLSNPEIAGRLFLSSRTVQYHLGKVFTKLGISSRSQLDRVLS